MKLDIQNFETKSSKEFENHMFGIGDERIILEILRNRMYSNPPRIICQEIMSNARDANREVNKFKVPIDVHLPTDLDPSYRVRDYGPSVTPERMASVFVKYGNSTKRDSNKETGGFGLGAKTPFSYTDTFTVISISPEESPSGGKINVKRTWVAIIDDSGYGQMNLLKEEITEEEQGTEVCVPVKPDDYMQFENWTKTISKYWKLKPHLFRYGDLINQENNEEEIDRKSKDDTWYVAKSGSAPNVILDGIPYRLNFDYLKLSENEEKEYQIGFNFERIPFRLFFKTGELTVTANREDLDYKEKTIKVIKRKLFEISETIRKQIEQEIIQAKSYSEAVILFQKIREKYKGLVKYVMWNGHKIEKNRFQLKERGYGDNSNYAIWSFHKFRHDNAFSFEGQKSAFNDITLKEDRIITIDDTSNKRPSRPRIARLFYENPDLLAVWVIKFFNKTSERKNLQETPLGAINPIRLSNVEMLRKPKTANGRTQGFILAYELREKRYGRGCIEWRPMKEFSFEGKGGVYVKYVNNSGAELTCGKEISGDKLLFVSRKLNKKIYAFTTRYLKKLNEKWIPLEEAAKDRILSLQKEKGFSFNKYVNRFCSDKCGNFEFELQYILNCSEFKKLLGPEHPLISYISFFENKNKKIKIVSKEKEIFFLAGRDGDKRFKIEEEDESKEITELVKEKKRLEKKYPLIAGLTREEPFFLREKEKEKIICKQLAIDLANYILMKDKMK